MAQNSVFSPLAGGTLDTYQYASESPFDLDAGLDYTRKTNTATIWPFPVVTGYIDGFLPLFDTLQYQTLMKGRTQSGPGAGLKGTPNLVIFPNMMGSLAKVGG